MPDLDQTESRNLQISDEGDTYDPSEIGAHAPFPFSPEPHYLSNDEVWIPEGFEDDGTRDLSPLSDDAKQTLLTLDLGFAKSDVAPRRIEIEQVWRSRHYKRGFQFLLHNRNGGWTMPGSGTNYGAWNQQLLTNLYQTNVYGEKGEIITAALSREIPRVQFFPATPDWGPDEDMAEVSDDLKNIWAKNNDLHCIVRDCADLFWTDDRVLLHTFYELNGDEYGYEDNEEPTVIEDALNPPPTPTAQEGEQSYQIENQSPQTDTVRRPRGRVKTVARGKLEHKCPLYVDGITQMGYVTISEDLDVAIVRAILPWMKSKVRGGGDAQGETELDRIARENVRQAVPGQYVTGDSLNRHCVLKQTYIRRATFFDVNVKDEVREELLAKFPDGCLLVKAATDFAFVRNEGADDHLTIGHPFPGSGQNRRSMGESLLPIQDYINELISLTLDFAKRTVPKKWMDSETFNIEAIKKQNNVPGSVGPFQRQPGVPVDQLVFVEPTPAPQPWLVSFVQWLITSLSEQISGALPSMFGAPITGQVGSEGVAIQRDQALQRVGCPWNSLQSMFASAARQAVMLTAKCANKDINDVIPGRGRVSIKLNKLKGNVLCYPESNPEFPESWSQKETRVMSILDSAIKAGANTEFYKMVFSPKNLKPIKSAIRLPDFTIAGAASVEKQEAELEILLRSGPLPNPQKVMLGQLLQQAQAGLQDLGARAQAGAAAPEELQQATVAPQLIAQLQQQLQSLPDEISTVPVRQDDSENHDVEADVIFDWANGPNGRKFANGTPDQQAAFKNALLHRTEHTQMSAKIKAANAPPPPPPKVSFSANVKDLPPPEQAEAVQLGGVPAKPIDFVKQAQVDLQTDVARKAIPKTLEPPKPTPKPNGSPNDSEPPKKLRR